MSDSHTNFSADRFSAGAGALAFGAVNAVAGALIGERDRLQCAADDAATDAALASWENLVADLTHEIVSLRSALDEADTDRMILTAELATLRQRCRDAGIA